MLQISKDDIDARLALDNPWWEDVGASAFSTSNLQRRVYFEAFEALALNYNVRRAAILLGPRRVGKTIMIKQLLEEAIKNGLPGSNVLYASIDTPLYSGLSLSFFVDAVPAVERGEQCLILFDEIQYLKDWQVHLKDLVDSYPHVKFVASGSAAAALKLQSQESGAGRFSDFLLPPLTFSEFVEFSEHSHLIEEESADGKTGFYKCNDVTSLNKLFIDYLNYGGYPEAVFNEDVRKNPDRFIRIDIIEKVLLNDLPSLYGITDIQELKKLFMFLAYNAGQEASFESISQKAGIRKSIVRNYIEYLESAFLIIKLTTVNDTCKTMQRERNFKIYLSNPSMRAALFGPIKEADTTLIGLLAESAVFSQWQHSLGFSSLRYARWRNLGEVDVVQLNQGTQKPNWIGEIKWSDQITGSFDKQTRHLKYLIERHPSIKSSFITTKTISMSGRSIGGRPLTVSPTALYCYTVGRNASKSVAAWMLNDAMETAEDEGKPADNS